MKSISLLATSGLTALALFPVAAFATVEAPACGQTASYWQTATNDGNASSGTGDINDSKLEIDFQGSGLVKVQPKSGWSIVSVQLDVDGDGVSGYVTHTSDFPGVYNPPGSDEVVGVKVTIKTADCPPPPPPVATTTPPVATSTPPVATSTPPVDEPITAPQSSNSGHSSHISGGGGYCKPDPNHPECNKPANYAYFHLPMDGNMQLVSLYQQLLPLLQKLLAAMAH